MLKDCLWGVAMFLIVVPMLFAMIAIIMTPLLYMDGRAKSRWIKETRGIDIPWYEASFLPVEISSSDIEASINQGGK